MAGYDFVEDRIYGSICSRPSSSPATPSPPEVPILAVRRPKHLVPNECPSMAKVPPLLDDF